MAFLGWTGSRDHLATIARLTPGIVVIGGVLLSWRFHRGRLLLALIVLALADRSLALIPADAAAAAGQGRLLFNAVAFLLPVNLAAIALLPERGVLTAAGINRLAAIFGQVAVIYMLHQSFPAVTADVLDPVLLPARLLAWTGLPQAPFLAALLGLSLVVARLVWRPDPVTRGFAWALVAVLLGLHAVPASDVPTVYFSTAGFILAVSVIESAYAMAYRDELTELPGRRALSELLARVGDRYTVAMVDIDRFKQINDRFGHDVGDQVLRMVAARLARVNSGGRAFRYGGEEFTVVFPDLSVDDSLAALEAVRREIADAPFTVRGADRPKRKPKRPKASRGPRRDLTVTVSIGVAEPSSKHPVPEEVIRAADQALYRAKEGGRNRVER